MGVIGVFRGYKEKFLVFAGTLFYEFKSRKQKTVPGLPISHYFGENLCSFIILYRSLYR